MSVRNFIWPRNEVLQRKLMCLIVEGSACQITEKDSVEEIKRKERIQWILDLKLRLLEKEIEEHFSNYQDGQTYEENTCEENE